MTSRIISTPQNTDPGTDGGIGYDFQKDLAVLLCIQMLLDKNAKYVVCEFHEDLVRIQKGWQLELIQVKKNQSKNWTLHSLIVPTKKQKKGILGKLFEPLQHGKDISRIAFCSYGRPGKSQKDGDCNLEEMIALLSTPAEIRDHDWQLLLQKYIDYLTVSMEKQEISRATIQKGFEILEIDLSLPHPDAMISECNSRLAYILKEIWAIELSQRELEKINQDIFMRVRKASSKAKLSWINKSIKREEITSIIENCLIELSPSENRKTALTTQEKLISVGLGNKTNYAFEKRLQAMFLKYELGLSSKNWGDYRADINVKCDELRQSSPNIKGANLWKALRQIFSDLGEKLASQEDVRLNHDFIEGVFFDMTGICEAQWMRQKSND